MHKVEKKDNTITGEEIFLPTSPEDIGGEKKDLDINLDHEPLPTKPEEVE